MATSDKVWLRDNLAKALGWDPNVAEEVVEAISSAQSKQERDDLVQGYLGGGPKVKALVDRFFRGSQQPSAMGHSSDARGREHKPGERQAGSVTIRHVASRQGPGKAQNPSARDLPGREVCNCISCGKIYFTKSDTADTIAFVGGPSTINSTEQTAAAIAFKDRLVDYDRNARQRTTVVDDQNDYFEIDTNAWLDPEEREQLKKQEREMREADEARRKRVTVTLDLLGRQVLLADNAPPPTEKAMLDAQRSASAAKATSAQRPHGGGTSAKAAMQAASRIQPNSSLKTERPIFVPTTPETTEERQSRRGVPRSAPASEAEVLQSVIGGWGDEKASNSQGSGLSSHEARQRQARTGGQQEKPAAQAKLAGQASQSAKKAKRPQLRRLQHDDPFEGADMLALDDIRPEEIPVQ